METKLRVVRLYGKLGAAFGRRHRLAVASTAEAIRALCVLLPGFERELANSQDRGVSYACFLGRRNLDSDQLHAPAGDEDIRIAPVLAGSKNGGLFQTILGAVIIAIAYINPFNFLTAPMVTAAYGLGTSLALGGVVQMLSPQQRGLSAKDSPENGASYNFNGPVNTRAQGNPVPLLYGEMFVGSAVISAGIAAEDQV